MSNASTLDPVQQPAKRPRQGGSIPKPKSAGPIEAGCSYTMDEFFARTRWSTAALRTARRNGLTVTRAGGICFIDGSDFLAYLKGLAGK